MVDFFLNFKRKSKSPHGIVKTIEAHKGFGKGDMATCSLFSVNRSLK